MVSLRLNPSQFASVVSGPMIPSVFLSLLAGLLVDRFGAKKVVATGLLISAVGTTLRLFANDYGSLLLAVILSGCGATVLNANGAKILGNWFEPEKVSFMVGIFVAASTLAITVAIGTSAMLGSLQTAYVVAAVVSIAVLLIWIALMKDEKKPTVDVCQTDLLTCMRVVVKSSKVWVVGFALLCLMGAMVGVAAFLPVALGSRGIGAVTAGSYAAVVPLGNVTGCFFAPLLAAKLPRIKPLLLVFSIISVLGGMFAWRAAEALLLTAALFITGIAMGSLLALLIAIPIQLSEIGTTYAGTAGGFAATLQLLGAVVIPSMILSPIAGSNYTLFFLLIGVVLLLFTAFVLFLPELGRKKKEA